MFRDNSATKENGLVHLTRREIDVLSLTELGFSAKEVAYQLNVSHNTVKKHLGNMYMKLGVRNNRRAVSRARELNLIP